MAFTYNRATYIYSYSSVLRLQILLHRMEYVTKLFDSCFKCKSNSPKFLNASKSCVRDTSSTPNEVGIRQVVCSASAPVQNPEGQTTCEIFDSEPTMSDEWVRGNIRLGRVYSLYISSCSWFVLTPEQVDLFSCLSWNCSDKWLSLLGFKRPTVSGVITFS